jgi:uncharacterized RmlC-like cupin family protein
MRPRFRGNGRRLRDPNAALDDSAGRTREGDKHETHKTAIYALSGEGAMHYGDRLEQHLIARAGDFVYTPSNVPHSPYNLSQTEPCLAIISRTDPNEQESVVLLPELDALHP